MPSFEHYSRDAEAAAFNEAMSSVSTIDAKEVVDAYDFSGMRTLVDVGGGHGLLLATALKAQSEHARCTL